MISWSHKRTKEIGSYVSLEWWKCSLQKHFNSNTFSLIHDTVNPSLGTKMFQSVICILGSPKDEYLLSIVRMFNGQLMSCLKRSNIMRLFVCLGNSEPFPLPLLSMTFIFVIIPFYLPLAQIFLFRIAWLYPPGVPASVQKFFFSGLPLLLCIFPNFTPIIDYPDTLNTKGLHQQYEQHIRLEVKTLAIVSDVLFTSTL